MEGSAQHGKKPFDLLGGIEGVRALANSLYDVMGELPEARKIRKMHSENLQETRENLALFLCGWLGGPSLYVKKYGSVNLTDIHASLDIDVAERDMWLSCMEKALNKIEIEDDLKKQLLKRFRIPAEKIRRVCQENRHRCLELI